MSERPTINQIYTALADDPKYSIGRALEIRQFVDRLPELTEYCLDWSVTPQNFFAVRAHLLYILVRSGEHPRPNDIKDILQAVTSWLAEPTLAYEAAHVSEEQYMLSDAVGLSEPLKDLYQQGSLTFRHVLFQQPALFLP